MTETMLVRAAGGGWEELRPQTTMPDGGLVDVFGEDIGPVLGAPSGVIVAACAPPLSTGQPDAICLDADGGLWIVQLALDGPGDQTLPQLLGFGGALTGMAYDTFEGICDRRGPDSLAEYVEGRSGNPGFHRQTFEAAVTDALAHGRFRLVAIVREAGPTLVQSMRFFNASGAMGSVYEATSFASASVSAVRAKAIDVGLTATFAAAPAAATAPPAPAATPAKGAAPASADAGAAFLAATGTAIGDGNAALMAQLQQACDETFDEVRFEGSGAAAKLRAQLLEGDEGTAMVVASTDGVVVLSFEALGAFDPGWGVRSELCQGMERLLGADLGDVRKISQLNLSIEEHLMDATLMEALADLLADTVRALRPAIEDARSGAREPAAA